MFSRVSKKLQKIRPYINGTVSVYPFFSLWVHHKNVIMLAIFLWCIHLYNFRKRGITPPIFLELLYHPWIRFNLMWWGFYKSAFGNKLSRLARTKNNINLWISSRAPRLMLFFLRFYAILSLLSEFEC